MSFWGKGRLAARTVAGLALLVMGSAVQAGVIGFESGNIVLNNTLNVPEFTSVSFAQSYDQAPLVFALASNQGSHPSALRVRNVSRDGFEIAQLEPDNLDGGHVSMAIDYFAITPGNHDLEALNNSGRSRLVSEICRFKAQIAANSELLVRFATKKWRISGPRSEFRIVQSFPWQRAGL